MLNENQLALVDAIETDAEARGVCAPPTDVCPPMARQTCPEGCVYGYHSRGGCPIDVGICTLCGEINFDDLTRQAEAITKPPGALPAELQGDGPCKDCGTAHNIRWFTESVFWNQVIGGPGTMGDPGGILCIPCFVKRTDAAGYWPRAWLLLPEWHWETRQERDARRSS